MNNENGDGHKTATVLPPPGRPFTPGHDPRRNAGGRPRGLAVAARAALGHDGNDVIEFFSAIMRGDRKFLGERRPIVLRDRMDAARWLADRGYGKPPQTVTVAAIELEEREQQMAELRTLTIDFTPEEKNTLRTILMARRERYLAAEREKAEAKVRSFLPESPHDGNGNGVR